MSSNVISTENERPFESTSIELSFNTGKGGAWDDRELIKASEAAMKEFHLHHPGPGSWLDKATAALAAGSKLPGAEDYGTSWYSASEPTEIESNQAQAQAQASTSTLTQTSNSYQPSNKKRKIKQNENVAVQNPYAPSTSTSTSNSNPNSRKRNTSPKYQPHSPTSGMNGDLLDDDDEEEDDDDDDDDYDHYEEDNEEYDEDEEWQIPNGWNSNDNIQNQQQGGRGAYDQLFPSLGIYPTNQINKEEALGYAMTAQYWAGYWMGVAQAQFQPQIQNRRNTRVPKQNQDRRKRSKQQHVYFHMDNEDAVLQNGDHELVGPSEAENGVNGDKDDISNIKITKKRFDRPVINGLKR
ncbi:uncharacterized protein L201_001340 [Kwoniella dendrophila CBS 6074]|uniref:Uncharacterized protein n=1 Tax=Kwoniella dendrophila CBS 6074 TaxID=1295534 RepID=A0AAX4JNL4_9TREE